MNELIKAILANDLLKIKRLICQEIDVNQLNSDDFFTPLMQAIDLNLEEAVKILLKAGADVNLSPSVEDTALGLAISNGNLEIVKLVLNAGADPNNGGVYDPLLSAVSGGDMDMVIMLLENGATTSSDWTPLMVAARKGDIDMIQFFVALDSNVNQTNDYGETALEIAASNGHQEVFDYLLQLTNSQSRKINAKKKLDVSKIRQRNLSQRLTFNISRNNLDGVRKAIKNGVNVNRENEENLLPLIAAVNVGSIEIVKLLIEARANVNVRDKIGNSALSIAVTTGNTEIVKLLVDAGAIEE